MSFVVSYLYCCNVPTYYAELMIAVRDSASQLRIYYIRGTISATEGCNRQRRRPPAAPHISHLPVFYLFLDTHLLIMAFRKPRKSSKRIIHRDTHDTDGPSANRESVIPHNYYEAGPSGVVFTDRILHVEVQDNPRPSKLPRFQSPPRGEKLSQPPDPLLIARKDEMPYQSPHTAAIADAHSTAAVECATPSSLYDADCGFPLSVDNATLPHSMPQPITPSQSVATPAEANCRPDSQRPLDTPGPENKKKKKVSKSRKGRGQTTEVLV